MIYYGGILRTTNPKTLRKWIENGRYQSLINKGYMYSIGCGRFRKFKCTCYKCRRKNEISN